MKHFYTAEWFDVHSTPQTSYAVVIAYTAADAEFQILRELEKLNPSKGKLVRIRPSTVIECLKHLKCNGNAMAPMSCDILWAVEKVSDENLPSWRLLP